MRRLRPALILPGARLQFSSTQPLAIPFTGEYELFRTSSGSLPKGAIVETGTPLESVYGTTNGGPMETIAVQAFEPPIDLIALRQGAGVADERGDYAATGIDATGGGAKRGRRRDRTDGDEAGAGRRRWSSGFRSRSRPMLVHAIRIVFQRPAIGKRNKNVRVAVEGFTLVPR